MQVAKRLMAKTLAADALQEVYCRLGSLREVARTLRTCKSWYGVSTRVFFWLRVVRSRENEDLQATIVKICLDEKYGHNGMWESWSFLRCDGSSMALFLANLRGSIGPERVMARLTRHYRLFPAPVVA